MTLPQLSEKLRPILAAIDGPPDSDQALVQAIDAAALVVRDTPRLTKAVHGLLADADRRRVLRDHIVRLVVHNDEVLGLWAAVMLGADAYAEVVDRHVELAGSLAWLGSLLDQSEPSGEA